MHFLYFEWHWAYFHTFRSHLKLSYELCPHYLSTFLSDHDLFSFFNSSSYNKESSLLLHELAIFFLGLYWFKKISIISCKYAVSSLTCVYESSHEMKKKSSSSLWQICVRLCLLLFLKDLLFFFSFMKAHVMFDYDYELHSLSWKSAFSRLK